MELEALLKALEWTQGRYKNEECIIYCDSRYVVSSFNEWLISWAQHNWMNSKKQTVENVDLMKRLYQYRALEFPNFTLEKVPGHVGLPGNELADSLCTHNQVKFAKILSDNNIEDPFSILY